MPTKTETGEGLDLDLDLQRGLKCLLIQYIFSDGMTAAAQPSNIVPDHSGPEEQPPRCSAHPEALQSQAQDSHPALSILHAAGTDASAPGGELSAGSGEAGRWTRARSPLLNLRLESAAPNAGLPPPPPRPLPQLSRLQRAPHLRAAPRSPRGIGAALLARRVGSPGGVAPRKAASRVAAVEPLTEAAYRRPQPTALPSTEQKSLALCAARRLHRAGATTRRKAPWASGGGGGGKSVQDYKARSAVRRART
ncbi:hypothetical protein H8959_019946, partial [Pygathrix nigripes]